VLYKCTDLSSSQQVALFASLLTRRKHISLVNIPEIVPFRCGLINHDLLVLNMEVNFVTILARKSRNTDIT